MTSLSLTREADCFKTLEVFEDDKKEAGDYEYPFIGKWREKPNSGRWAGHLRCGVATADSAIASPGAPTSGFPSRTARSGSASSYRTYEVSMRSF